MTAELAHDPAPGSFAPPGAHADVAVIVVTYNSGGDIETLIDDLRGEALGLSVRLVIVDNDSADGTPDLVAAHEDVVLVRAGGNLGYSGGINVGRRHAGPCASVLVLNPDLRVRPGAVGVMLDALEGGAASGDPVDGHSVNGHAAGAVSVGAVVPRIVGDDGSTYPSLRGEPTLLRALGDAVLGSRWPSRPSWSREGVYEPEAYASAGPVDWATGAAILMTAKLDATLGDWPEAYFLYSEETEHMRRIRDSGRLVWYEPAAVVQHSGAGSGTSPALATLMAVNRIRYIERHRGRAYAAGFRAAVALSELLRSADADHRRTLGVVLDRARWADLPRATDMAARELVPGSLAGSVVIPAHNEAAVISRTLEPLAAAAATGALEVIVVCNGCSDDTADIARSYPGITVVETGTPSKIVALNLGDDTATAWPRLYLDADIVITPAAVARVFGELRSGRVLAARPTSGLDTAGASAIVRSYYRARGRIPRFGQVLWGAGAYAVSADGHARLGRFPDLVGDDLWVDHQFTAAEKTVVATEPALVATPRDLRSLLSVLRRWVRGKDDVAGAEPAAHTLKALVRTIRGPRSAMDAGVYVAMSLVARGRSPRSAEGRWARDNSGRNIGE